MRIASLVVGNAIRRGGLALDGPVGALRRRPGPAVRQVRFQGRHLRQRRFLQRLVHRPEQDAGRPRLRPDLQRHQPERQRMRRLRRQGRLLRRDLSGLGFQDPVSGTAVEKGGRRIGAPLFCSRLAAPSLRLRLEPSRRRPGYRCAAPGTDRGGNPRRARFTPQRLRPWATKPPKRNAGQNPALRTP